LLRGSLEAGITVFVHRTVHATVSGYLWLHATICLYAEVIMALIRFGWMPRNNWSSLPLCESSPLWITPRNLYKALTSRRSPGVTGVMSQWAMN